MKRGMFALGFSCLLVAMNWPAISAAQTLPIRGYKAWVVPDTAPVRINHSGIALGRSETMVSGRPVPGVRIIPGRQAFDVTPPFGPDFYSPLDLTDDSRMAIYAGANHLLFDPVSGWQAFAQPTTGFFAPQALTAFGMTLGYTRDPSGTTQHLTAFLPPATYIDLDSILAPTGMRYPGKFHAAQQFWEFIVFYSPAPFSPPQAVFSRLTPSGLQRTELTLPGTNPAAQVFGINDRSEVVGEASGNATALQATLWSVPNPAPARLNGTPLPVPPQAVYSTAKTINNHGTAGGSYFIGITGYGALWFNRALPTDVNTLIRNRTWNCPIASIDSINDRHQALGTANCAGDPNLPDLVFLEPVL